MYVDVAENGRQVGLTVVLCVITFVLVFMVQDGVFSLKEEIET